MYGVDSSGRMLALSRKQYVGILMENGTLERWYSEEDKKSQVFKLLVSISPKLGNNEIEFIRQIFAYRI